MKENIINNQSMLKIIQALFLIKAAVWVIFAVIHLFRFQTDRIYVMAFLLFVDAAIFLWMAKSIIYGKKWIYYFAIVFIAVNLILTICDEFGIFDFMVLIFDSAIFILLIRNKKTLINSSQ